MTASVSRLHVGDGYSYLTRQVANGDQTRERGHELTDYYHAEGCPPGHWHGDGAGVLGVAGVVTEQQMAALFGEGMHPDADRLMSEALRAGAGEQQARKAALLGREIPRFDSTREDSWRDAKEHAEQVVRSRDGVAEGVALTREQRREVRTSAGRSLFEREKLREPATATELEAYTVKRARPTAAGVSGYDVTFTPVKSVSVLWGLGDEDTRRAIEDAHAAAVGIALDYIETEVLHTRSGAAGIAQHDASGMVAARFDHFDSRTGDPNLHTHVAIANRVQGPDGKWRSIDGRTIFAANVSYSEVYNSALEDQVKQRLDVEFVERGMGQGKRPVREVAGVDARFSDAFATRRSAIEEVYTSLLSDYRRDHSHEPSRAVQMDLAQRATLETRTAKGPMESLAIKRARWHEAAVVVTDERTVATIGAEVALHAQRVRDGAADDQAGEREGRTTPSLLDDRGRFVGVAAAGESVIEAVATDRASWRIWHLRAEAYRQVRAVTGLDRRAREQLAEEVTGAAAVGSVLCEPPESQEVPAELRRSNGEVVFRQHGGQRYTSRAVLAAEAVLVDAARTPVPGVISPATVGRVVEGVAAAAAAGQGHGLDAGQVRLVEAFATADRQLVVAIGPAGAGKTRALRALVDAAAAEGRTVVGLAPSAAAAALFGQETGASRFGTVDMTLTRARHLGEDAAGVDAGDVVVVDEAGMAGTQALAELNALCERRGAVLRLIGDDQQLAAVAAGGALRLVAHEVGAVQLTDLHRFTDPEEAANTLRVRDGDHAAIGFYDDSDRLRGGSREAMLEELYADWKRDLQAGASSVMIAGDNETVAELSDRARTERVAAGVVSGPGTRLRTGSEAAAGDLVVTRRNNRILATGRSDFVKNGDLWEVTARHDHGGLRVRSVRHGGTVDLPADYVARHVELGYATTVHRAQGMTVNTARTLVDPERMTREHLYVALTRGREANVAYALTDPFDALHVDHQPAAVTTATAALAAVLDRTDDAARSASETIDVAYGEAESLHQLVPEYEHALGLAHAARVDADVQAVLGEERATEVREDPAFGALRARLAARVEAGQDPAEVLTRVVRRGELATAVSPAATLSWRLDQLGTVPRGELAPGRDAATELGDVSPGLGRWLRAQQQRIEARNEHVSRAAVEERPTWTMALRSGGRRIEEDLVVAVARYRDRYAVKDSLRPLGVEPEDQTRQQLEWRSLSRAVAAAPVESVVPGGAARSDRDQELAPPREVPARDGRGEDSPAERLRRWARDSQAGQEERSRRAERATREQAVAREAQREQERRDRDRDRDRDEGYDR